MTKRYHARSAWLSRSPAAIDGVVWAAHGWEDADPAAVDEDVILAWLLALNLERAAGEVG